MEQFLDNFFDLLEEADRMEITENTKFKDLEEWDSMTTLMLIAMFDDEYSVKLNGDDIRNAETLADLFNLTQK